MCVAVLLGARQPAWEWQGGHGHQAPPSLLSFQAPGEMNFPDLRSRAPPVPSGPAPQPGFVPNAGRSWVGSLSPRAGGGGGMRPAEPQAGRRA